MKKVAILLPWLEIGGTNVVALRFIEQIKEKCDVTLILLSDSGSLRKKVPEDIKILVAETFSFRDLLVYDISHLQIKDIFEDFKYYSKIKSKRDTLDNYSYFVKRNPLITETDFDCAIAYHGQSPALIMSCLYRIKSKKRIVWIHGAFNDALDHEQYERYFLEFNKMFVVSKETLKTYTDRMMLSSLKPEVYINPLNAEDIIKLSNEKYETNETNLIKLCTVGRLTIEKGVLLIPEIVLELNRKNIFVSWVIIGKGDLEEKLRQKISDNNLSDQIIMKGALSNPYPFMAECDIYIQPSYSEGYSTTICEAGVLGKAIIGTKNSGGIKNQIISGESGLIVQTEVKSIASAIITLIEDKDLRLKFGENIKKIDFSGANEVQKFFRYLYS